MVEEHITLIEEEIDSLDNFKEICIYENEEKDIKLFIRIPYTKEQALKQDILDRYNNIDYWNEDLEQSEKFEEL